MTATEASRTFAALLDEVEKGETIIVTRGGKRVATIEPASAGNGGEIAALLAAGPPDDHFADDVESVQDLLGLDPVWPED